MKNMLQTLAIKNMHLKNRLIMPPMATEKSGAKGHISKEILDYYEEKSKGGYIALFIIEHSYVSLEGKASANQLSVADEDSIAGLSHLSKVIQKNGSKAIMQINHAGSAADIKVTGHPSIGPSPVANPRLEGVPLEMTKADIDQIIGAFVDSARRVKASGFDGVEIHSAHGYFLNQFYSPLTNKRNDEYGGDVHNRIRLHLQIIKAVRKEVGSDYPIFLRLGAFDYKAGGTTLEDSLIASKAFEKAGVDVLDISGGFCGYYNGNPVQGYFSELSEKIKAVVTIPVILTGGIKDIEFAEKLLVENKADLIGVGRAIYTDSTWAKKSIEGLKK